MTSAFAQLPAAVLSEILCLTPFVDTLRCEQVCRTWRKVLKCSTAATEDLQPTWSPGDWCQELQLLVATPEDDWAEPTLKLAQHADSRLVVVTMVPSSNDTAHLCSWYGSQSMQQASQRFSFMSRLPRLPGYLLT